MTPRTCLVAAALLAATGTAHAGPDATTGLDARGEGDAAATRGTLLPGGYLDPAGTVGIDAIATAIPLIGAARAHVAVDDRVEIFGAIEWVRLDIVERSNSHGWQLGARVQVFRRDRLSVALEAFGGARERDELAVDLGPDTFARLVGAGAGLSACIDDTCRTVAHGQLRLAMDLDARNQYDQEQPNAGWALASAGVVTGGRHVRAVFDLGTAHGADDVLYLTTYAGGRYARRHLAFDLGAIYALGSIPVPVIGLAVRN